ncbi:MAG: methyltransferase domain-containing protein [Chroococcidiopsidaceae cyanobacterium CP_BM_ER_R8_30]|nr:methyltransferase domain-containing protein [Chroococcidiopsidaceae cyanobacterium CP_BM_ER_R8_30]
MASNTSTSASGAIFPGEVFAQTADFDAGIRALIPRYDEMLEAIAHCLPSTATRILELGCGTGELSLKVLEICPEADLVAIDYSPRMLSYAQAKIKQVGKASRVTWIEADFGDWASGNVGLQTQKFDVCVSSLAIHHLEDAIKLKLFQRICTSLNPGGSFWNADPVLSESPAMSEIYDAAREEWAAQQGTTLTEVRAKRGTSNPQGYSNHDRLATVTAHLEMLTQAGFQTVAVPWKYYGLAVFGGFVGK